MRIALCSTQVPFVRGGAELLAESLKRELEARAHEVDLVRLPFKWYPPQALLDGMLASQLVDLGEASGAPIDRVIGLKFPAYLVPHPRKRYWLLHQHRQAYDLWEHPDYGDLIGYPDGRLAREAIHASDRGAFERREDIYTISGTVSARLERYLGIRSTPLYHPPPLAGQLRPGPAADALLYPSRLAPMKRQGLVLDALARTREPVRLRFVGRADTRAHHDHLVARTAALGISDRVTFVGGVTDAELVDEYASALGVVFTPFDEDYGYVSLEAMLAAKPLLTCTDSGGTLDFVQHGVTGYVCDPEPEALAGSLDAIWRDRERAGTMGAAGRSLYTALGVDWQRVVERLLA